MKKKYKPKDTGHISLQRNVQKLITSNLLSFTTLGAYLCFVMQADWDRRHTTYRAILPEDKELAEFLGIDGSTVYLNRIKLIKVGLLEVIDGNTYIKNLEMFRASTVSSLAKIEDKLDKLHDFYAKSETELAESMFSIEKTQEE